jgi:lipopolysaccharide exporter
MSNTHGLRHRVVKSSVWVFGLRITERLFYFIRIIILARILSPEDFGLLGIAMLTMLTIENFTQTGFHSALIQKQQNIAEYLNASWTVGIIRSIILFILLYIGAPYAATFFGVPHAKAIIQVVGVSILLQSFTNIGVIYFQKNLEFHKQFFYQLSGTLADFIVAVSATLILKNAWALVFGLLAGNAARLIMSYVVHPHRPRISLDIGKAKELFGFGKWVLGSSILLFLITQGDAIVVGKLLGATMLGFYQMAYRISNVPATEITHVFSQVLYPAYSKLQDNVSRLREAFMKGLQVIAFISFPVAGLIFILAPDFTKIFLGEKWLPMVPAMQVLAIAGLIRSLAAVSGHVFYAVGKPGIDTRLQVARCIILAVLIYPLTVSFGIVGAAFAVLANILVANVGFAYTGFRLVNARFSEYASSVGFPLAGMVVGLLITSQIKAIFGVGIWSLILYISVFLLSYCAIAYLSVRLFSYGIQTIIRDSLRALRGI